MSNGSPTPYLISNIIVNYVTPGYATAVYVSASGVERIRTTAESHRRIAIIEVVWNARLDPAKFSGLTEGDATHPQRRRPRQRGCHSVPGHFLQTARNPRMVYHSSY